MSFKIKIAEADDFSQEVITFLEEVAIVDTTPCHQGEIKEVLESYDVFWFRLGYRIDKSLFSDKTRCKIIATPVTGIDHIDEEACRQFGIKIICLRGEKEFLKEVRATAELTIALTFLLMRNMVVASNDVVKGNCNRDAYRGFEVYKKTVGIIGLGRLGKITAGYFKALGAKVVGYDIRYDEDHKDIILLDSIEEVIHQADIISIHVKYDDTTHHLFDKAILDLFDHNKWLINTSRGGVIDESALLSSLQNKRIAGAALDVLYDEHKIDHGHPLVQYAASHRNLIITPHIGGNTYESFEKTEQFIAEKIVKEINQWQQ